MAGDGTDAWFDGSGATTVTPRPHANAPWTDGMLHGRFLAGLVARAVDAAHAGDDWQPARLTIDLFRSPPMSAVEVSSDRIRDGGRVRVVDAVLAADGREIARARVLLLRRTGKPVGEVWSPPAWDFAPPDQLESPPGFGGDDRIWQFRTEPGRSMGQLSRKRMWLRDTAELVAGEPLTPFVRVAMVADFASPLANSGPDGLSLINADISLSIARLPASDWIGFEVLTHDNADGVSAASCQVYDLEGSIGLSAVSAVTY